VPVVSDVTHRHATVLPSSVSIRDALANYEAGHVTAGEEAGSHITDVAEWSDNGLREALLRGETLTGVEYGA
jgi:hypothetical protein